MNAPVHLRLYATFPLLVTLTAVPALSGTPSAHSALVLFVDDDASPGGNGSGASPYRSLADAVDRARHESRSRARVRIEVAPGEYPLGSPLVLDFPITIRGANVLETDPDEWPTGTVPIDRETRVTGPSCSGPLIVIGGVPGTVVSDVSIEKLTLEGSATGCYGVQVQRAANVFVGDSVLRGPGFIGVDWAAASGTIARNHVTGFTACGICITAGTTASPSVVMVRDNRSVGNVGGGLLLAGTPYPILEPGDALDADVRHNDLSGNFLNPVLGFGLRVFMIGLELPAGESSGNVRARIRDNRMADNRYGVVLDAGFPHRNLPSGSCDDRAFTGEFDLSLRDNAITGNLERNALVSFTRNTVLTAGNPLSRWQYLHDATFVIDDPDLTLQPWLVDHPSFDPFTGGSCADDVANEPLRNRLIYNGLEIAESP